MNSLNWIATFLNEIDVSSPHYASSASIAISTALILVTICLFSSKLREFVWNVIHFYRKIREESSEIEQLKANHNATYKRNTQAVRNHGQSLFTWKILHLFRVSEGYISWLDKQTQGIFASLRTNLPVLFMIDRKLARRMWKELIDCDVKYVLLAFVSLIVSKLIGGTFVISARANFFRLMYNELEPILSNLVNSQERAQLASIHLGKIIENVVWQLVLEFLVRFFRSLFEYASSTLRFSRSSARRRRYLRSLLRKNDAFYREFPWDLYMVARNDPNSVDELLFDVLPTILGNLVELVTASIGMLHIDLFLTIVAILTWIPAKLGLFQMMWGFVHPFEIVQRDTQEKYQAKLREVFSNIQLIQSHSAEEFMVLEAEILSNKMDACSQFRIWPRFAVEISAETIQKFLDMIVRVVAICNALYNSSRFHISDFTKFEQYLSRLNFGWTSLCSSAMHGKTVVEQVYRYYSFVDQHTSFDDLEFITEREHGGDTEEAHEAIHDFPRESLGSHVLDASHSASTLEAQVKSPEEDKVLSLPRTNAAPFASNAEPLNEKDDNQIQAESVPDCSLGVDTSAESEGEAVIALSSSQTGTPNSSNDAFASLDDTVGKEGDASLSQKTSTSSASTSLTPPSDQIPVRAPQTPPPSTTASPMLTATSPSTKKFSGIFASMQMQPIEMAALYQKYITYSIGRYKRSHSIDADLSPLEETFIPTYPTDSRYTAPNNHNGANTNNNVRKIEPIEHVDLVDRADRPTTMLSSSLLTKQAIPLFPLCESPISPTTSEICSPSLDTDRSGVGFLVPSTNANVTYPSNANVNTHTDVHPGKSLRVTVPESAPNSVTALPLHNTQQRPQLSVAFSCAEDNSLLDLGATGRVLTPTLMSPIVTPRACIVQLESSVYRKSLSGTIEFRNVYFRYKKPADTGCSSTSIGPSAAIATGNSAIKGSVSNSTHKTALAAGVKSGAGALAHPGVTSNGNVPGDDDPNSHNHPAWVLRSLSFIVSRGTCVALVGSSGSGKTSIVQLLLRLQQHELGSITIDDIPIQQYEPRSLRRQVGYVEQEPRMLTRSVRENILLGVYLGTRDVNVASSVGKGIGSGSSLGTMTKGSVDKLSDFVAGIDKTMRRNARNKSDSGDSADGDGSYGYSEEVLRKHWEDEVIRAAKLAQIHDDIMKLPKGYDTVLGKDGQLSGGQKQRLAIARAIVRNPSILILDEATSALDSETEQNLTLAIEQVMMNRTTLVIAHRLSTVVRADKILLIDKGQVVESGTHRELCAKNGRYAQFVAAQLLPT